MTQVSYALAGLTVLLLCAGCAGRDVASLAVDSGQSGVELPGASLPTLAELPAPKEALSLPAPGFHQLDHLATLARENAVDDLGSIKMDNSTNVLTYALYGVYGFDGDAYPVSVKLNVGDASGDFYLAFSDYTAGTWQLTGPFNADGEFGLPLNDEYTDPATYISPMSYHYFAVLAAPGALVYIDGVELGVSGGDNAPEPVLQIEGQGGANGILISWYHSPSYRDPDFAGYIVERAPQFGGVFTPMTAEPDPADHYLDASAALGSTYRYRVAAYDFSGNVGLSAERSIAAVAGLEAKPVAVVELPAGPLYAPADVSFDMSGSFDPEGEGIVSWSVNYFTQQGETSHLGPAINVVLEPGCYVFNFEVECADGRSGRSMQTLKVYPQWQETSVLVRATEPTNTWKKARLFPFKGGKQPSDDRLTLAGFDGTVPGLVFHHYTGAGEFSVHRTPQVEWVEGLGEPLTLDQSLVFPFSTAYSFMAAAFDGEQVQLMEIGDTSNSYAIELTRDSAGRVWAAYGVEDAGNTDIRVDGDLSALASVDIATVPIAADYIDIETDPATGQLLVFYEDAAGAVVTGVDQDNLLPLGTVPLGAGDVFMVDAEVNPENNRVGVIYNTDSHIWYREQDGIGGWTAAVEIDNSLLNEQEADLEPSSAGQLNAYFALNSGQAHRYIYSGGIWSPANVTSFSADSGYYTCLLPIASSPDMTAVDLCVDGVIRLARMNDDGTDNVFASIDSAIGQGRDMHGAGGSDGLHLLWSRVFEFGGVTHSISSGPDEGSAWGDANAFAATNGLNLVGNEEGDVYATGFNALAATLYWWDSMGGNFMADQSFPAQFLHRPALGEQFGGPGIYFGVWDEAGNQYHRLSGRHGFYAPPSFGPLDINPVWDAAIDSHPISGGNIIVAGPNQNQPFIGWNPFGSDYFDLYSQVQLSEARSPYDKASVNGRSLGSSVCFTGLTMADALSSATVASMGAWVHPVRFTRMMGLPLDVFEYPIGEFEEFIDGRNTVSVATANSCTAVNLVCSLDGSESHFEWSDMGNWEQLALPEGLDNMSSPLVVVGYDGRWHLVYRDWKTDSIMCRSSL